jgi:hypothetical protein
LFERALCGASADDIAPGRGIRPAIFTLIVSQFDRLFEESQRSYNTIPLMLIVNS